MKSLLEKVVHNVVVDIRGDQGRRVLQDLSHPVPLRRRADVQRGPGWQVLVVEHPDQVRRWVPAALPMRQACHQLEGLQRRPTGHARPTQAAPLVVKQLAW